MRTALKLVAINIVGLIILVTVIEGGSWLVLKAYYGLFFTSPYAETVNAAELKLQELAEDSDDNVNPFFHEETVNEYQEWRKIGWRFRPFIMYEHKPWASEYLNVSEHRYRLNGNAIDKPNSPVFDIWFFGSSTLFAPEAPDKETIPAYVERILNETYPDVNIRAFNYGQVGYKAH